MRTVVVAVLALLAMPAAAHAFGISKVGLTAADPRAGAHSNVTLSVNFSQADDQLRDIRVDLPPGLLGNPRAVPQCSQDQLQANACPPDTQVGTTTVVASALILPIPLPSFGKVYNVTPPPNRPARLGVVVDAVGGLLGQIILPVDITVRDDGDYGLVNTIDDVPHTLIGFVEVAIQSMDLTLFGTTPSGGKFMVNPTQCDPGTVKVTASSWKAPANVTATGSFQATDCGNVPYDPQMQLTFADPRIDVPSEATIGLTLPADVGDRVPSHTRKSIVRLPAGIGFNAGVANGLQICTPQQFGAQGDPDVRCPASSQVGTVVFDNPLLGNVDGVVFFGRDLPDHPYQIYILAQKQGVTVKLVGDVRPDEDTGAVTTVLDGIPQVPFTQFLLTFRGGPKAALTTPPACGDYTASITNYPYSGTAPKAPTATESFSDDGQGNCNPTLTPSIQGSVSTTRALGSPTLSLTIGRSQSSRPPTHIDTVLPKGMVGRVFDVPFCPRSQVGNCPDRSKIGNVVSTIGSGPAPATVSGEAFLTSGTSTAIARLVIELRVLVGPFDLGTFTTLAPLTLGERDGRVHVVADLPPAFAGFPVRLQGLKLTINRKNFNLNPSGCDARTFDVAMTSADGTTGAASAPFEATACDQIKFRPKLETQINDRRQKVALSQPPLTTVITKPTYDSAVNDVRLLLAPGLVPNTEALQLVCDLADWRARTCPKRSQVGTAVANTPLLQQPLRGPIYLAQTDDPEPPQPGIALPSLSVQLAAPGVSMTLIGHLRVSEFANRLEAHFSNLPDVPLRDFQLTLFGASRGRPGPVVASDSLCSLSIGRSDARLIDQSGQAVTVHPRVDAAACRQGPLIKGAASGLAGSKPRLTIRAARNTGDRRLRRIRFRLPEGLHVRSSKVRSGVSVAVEGKQISHRFWSVTRHGTVSVRVPGRRGADRVTVVLAKGALRASKSLRQRATRRLQGVQTPPPVSLSVRVDATDVKGRGAATSVRFETRQGV